MLERAADGSVKPTKDVGCSFLAQGLECPKGGVLNGSNGQCPFSHKSANVDARKKFLKEHPELLKRKGSGKGKGGGRGGKAATGSADTDSEWYASEDGASGYGEELDEDLSSDAGTVREQSEE